VEILAQLRHRGPEAQASFEFEFNQGIVGQSLEGYPLADSGPGHVQAKSIDRLDRQQSASPFPFDFIRSYP
jgi:hypothetical protein